VFTLLAMAGKSSKTEVVSVRVPVDDYAALKVDADIGKVTVGALVLIRLKASDELIRQSAQLETELAAAHGKIDELESELRRRKKPLVSRPPVVDRSGVSSIVPANLAGEVPWSGLKGGGKK
jgi:hypothetical protein